MDHVNCSLFSIRIAESTECATQNSALQLGVQLGRHIEHLSSILVICQFMIPTLPPRCKRPVSQALSFITATHRIRSLYTGINTASHGLTAGAPSPPPPPHYQLHTWKKGDMAFNFIDGLQNSMGFTSLGIMQRINTGHPMLDMLLIALAGVLVPALVSRQLSPEALWERLSEWVRRRFQRRRFWRHVQSVTREGRFGTEPQDDGYILQTAILLYLGSRKDIVAKSEVPYCL